MTGTEPSWKFHPHRPGDAWDGAGVQMVIRTELDNFVREVVQNVIDQRVSTEEAARVEFVIQDHEGTTADRLLSLIGWGSGLKKHMTGVAEGDNHLSERLKVAIASAEDRRIRTLTIHDSETNGLTGPEEHSGNFANLCRHVMVTDHGGKARGGAFGIGKSVLWAFSRGSVVFFSSRFKDDDGSYDYRAIGRCFFPSHRTADIGPDKRYEGNAWFGATETTPDGQYTWTKSLRSEEARLYCAGTPLERDGSSTGTSIMIPFFGSPVEEEDPTGSDLVEQLQFSVVKWFWPAIHDGFLDAQVEFIDTTGRSLAKKVSLESWMQPFIRVLEYQDSTEFASEPGSMAGLDIELAIPARRARENKHSGQSAPVSLAVTRLGEDEIERIPKGMLNSVALVRGVRMVVQYLGGMPDSLPAFVGILKAGTLHGKEAGDSYTEYFLRDSEPPAHDRWELTAKIRENYSAGGGARLQRLLEDIRAGARKLLGNVSSSEGSTPKKLADLLKGRRPGAERKPSSTRRIQISEPTITRTGLIVEGTCKVEGPKRKPWTVYLRLVAVTEDNRKIPLDHGQSIVQPRGGAGVTWGFDEPSKDEESGQLVVPGVVVFVPSNVSEFSLTFSASAEFLGAAVFRRARIEISSRKSHKSEDAAAGEVDDDE